MVFKWFLNGIFRDWKALVRRLPSLILIENLKKSTKMRVSSLPRSSLWHTFFTTTYSSHGTTTWWLSDIMTSLHSALLQPWRDPYTHVQIEFLFASVPSLAKRQCRGVLARLPADLQMNVAEQLSVAPRSEAQRGRHLRSPQRSPPPSVEVRDL